MKALEAKFCNDMGFNYIAFLQELQPYTPPDFMYEKRLEEVRQTNVRTRLPETDPISDLEGVLIKIKTKVGYQWLLSSQADKRPLFTNTIFFYCKIWMIIINKLKCSFKKRNLHHE